MTSIKLYSLGLAAMCAVGMSGCGAGSENLPAGATRPVETGAEIDAGRPFLDGGGPQTEEKKIDPTGGGPDFDGFGVKESSPPPPVPQVEADDASIEKNFVVIEEPPECPEFLKAKQLVKMIPGPYRADVRDEIVDGFEGGGCPSGLEGVFIDEAKTRFLLHYQYGGVESVTGLVTSGGKTGTVLRFSERASAGYLVDVAGDDTPEIIIPVIVGNALSSWPSEWRIYQLNGNKLSLMGRVAKSYSSGSKWERYYFLNSITFPKKGKMRVETTLRAAGDLDMPARLKGVPKRKGELSEYEVKGGKFRLTSFTKGKLDPDSLDDIFFEVAIHVATEDMENTRKRIEQKIDTANEKFEGIAVGFEAVDEFHVLSEDFATLDNSPERHKLKKYLVDRAINVFVVDTILDPHPSGATKKAAKWQGRKPSGRLAGAHIEVKNKKPHTYIILKARSSSVSLAHELGHFLGLPHHKDPTNIMSYGTGRQNFNDDQLEIMRRFAQKTKRKRLVGVID